MKSKPRRPMRGSSLERAARSESPRGVEFPVNDARSLNGVSSHVANNHSVSNTVAISTRRGLSRSRQNRLPTIFSVSGGMELMRSFFALEQTIFFMLRILNRVTQRFLPSTPLISRRTSTSTPLLSRVGEFYGISAHGGFASGTLRTFHLRSRCDIRPDWCKHHANCLSRLRFAVQLPLRLSRLVDCLIV